MRIGIQHIETKEVYHGEWDSEGLYFHIDNYCIPLDTYNSSYKLFDPVFGKVSTNVYEYRSYTTNQLEFEKSIMERDIKNNMYKVKRDQKKLNRINKILNK